VSQDQFDGYLQKVFSVAVLYLVVPSADKAGCTLQQSELLFDLILFSIDYLECLYIDNHHLKNDLAVEIYVID
jgi:hypothetical protein